MWESRVVQTESRPNAAADHDFCLPGEDRKLWLDDLDPDDDEEQGADDENDELQQSLEDSVGEASFTLQDLAQRVQQRGQCELRVDAKGQLKPTRQSVLAGNTQMSPSLTPCATKTSWMQQIPTTVIPCSLHSVAAATRTTVRAMGAHTGKQERLQSKFIHVFYTILLRFISR